MTPDLSTTNLMLALIAAATMLQALLLVGAAIAGFVLYRRMSAQMAELEAQQLAPLRARVDDILADVKRISARVSDRTERVDVAIQGTMERVDETAARVKHSVRDRVDRAAGIVRGIRAVIASMLSGDSRHEPPEAAASGRA
jgi:hypothetical protein